MKSSLPLRFTFLLSLSFAASYTVYSYSPPFSSRLKLPSDSKATAFDLLSILGTPQQAAAIDPKVANELRSCFKFLVPFSPSQQQQTPLPSSMSSDHRRRRLADVNDLIWRPPPSVLELARLAMDTGGDPDSIHRTLDPIYITVPDAEKCQENHCELTRTPYGRRFIDEELNSYVKFLFETIADLGSSVGFHVSLNRFDLFHGHMFIATESRRLGILFHAKEYPMYDKKVFPHYMGYCQIGSNVVYDDSMNLRNILWLAPLPSETSSDWLAPGVLVILDAHQDGIIYRDIIPQYVQYARTIYEDDFGEVVVDVNYLNVGVIKPDYQLFIC
ncbi:uncharacterized protein LOC124930928 [Impatiens glandulifera]|uniref:uncharacterized protein LOC124930928 n=1 Tax=Impatiens glandulifera TaxID=253017 RepID=UPI001FB17846|nr:uncharacterized protein LOC124930928 [Impatiens glandulifera]